MNNFSPHPKKKYFGFSDVEDPKFSYTQMREGDNESLHRHALNNNISIAIEKHQMMAELKHHINEDLSRLSGKKDVLNQVSQYIYDKVVPHYPKYEKLAFKLDNARESGCIGFNPDSGFAVAWDVKANSALLCPFDSNTETKRLIDRYLFALKKKLEEGYNLYYCVFSCPNYSNLHEGKRDTFTKFSNLLRSRPMEHVHGAIVRQEDPLSVHGDWNIHLNAFMLVKGRLDYKEVQKNWSDRYGVSCQFYAKKIQGDVLGMTNSFLEAFKYSTVMVPSKSANKFKSRESDAPAMTQWSPHDFVDWVEANKGFRRTRTYGNLYGSHVPKPPKINVITEETQWIGVIKHDINGYRVNYCADVEALSVSSIQADNFATQKVSDTDKFNQAVENYLHQNHFYHDVDEPNPEPDSIPNF